MLNFSFFSNVASGCYYTATVGVERKAAVAKNSKGEVGAGSTSRSEVPVGEIFKKGKADGHKAAAI